MQLCPLWALHNNEVHAVDLLLNCCCRRTLQMEAVWTLCTGQSCPGHVLSPKGVHAPYLSSSSSRSFDTPTLPVFTLADQQWQILCWQQIAVLTCVVCFGCSEAVISKCIALIRQYVGR